MRLLDELHSGASGVWESTVDGAAGAGRLGGQSQAGGATAAGDGSGGAVSQALAEPAGGGARIYPYLLKGSGDHRSGPGVVQRHHVCADGLWVHVSGGGDGLVEPVCAGVGVVQHAGSRVLYSGVGSGAGPRTRGTADLQHRSGLPVHQRGYIDAVESAGVEVSMDGRGRWIDNRFIERLWRSVKYEDIYRQDYGDGLAAGRGLAHGSSITTRSDRTSPWRMPRPPSGIFRPRTTAGAPPTWEAMKSELTAR